MTPKKFIETLMAVKLANVFNPYTDQCPIYDRKDAAQLRRQNLCSVLDGAIKAGVDTIWIARDLGYRGGRRTGVALTDEVHLKQMEGLFRGISLERATKGPVIAERTAAVVWKVIGDIQQPVFLWNVFPFHPHEPHDPLSNRCHTRIERDVSLPILQTLISMFKARRLVAIGRDAQLAVKDIDIPVVTVRHPSYGGQSEFMSSLHDMYGLNKRRSSIGSRVTA